MKYICILFCFIYFKSISSTIDTLIINENSILGEYKLSYCQHGLMLDFENDKYSKIFKDSIYLIVINKNSHKVFEANIIDFNIVGKMKLFYSNGNLKEEGIFKLQNDFLGDVLYCKEGEFNYYTKKNKLRKKYTYIYENNDSLIIYKNYFIFGLIFFSYKSTYNVNQATKICNSGCENIISSKLWK